MARCEDCNGTGRVIKTFHGAKGKSASCPMCGGHGTRTTPEAD